MFWCSLVGADRPPKEKQRRLPLLVYNSRKIWVLVSFAGSGK